MDKQEAYKLIAKKFPLAYKIKFIGEVHDGFQFEVIMTSTESHSNSRYTVASDGNITSVITNVESKSEKLIKLINEEDINLEPLAQELKSAIEKIFPKSTTVVSKVRTGDDYFFLKFYLAGSRSEVGNEIWENDICDFSFSIYNRGSAGHSVQMARRVNVEPGDEIQIEGSSTSITIKPEDRMYAQGRLKTGWVNRKTSPEKVVPYMVKHFEKVKQLLGQNLDKMFDPEFVKSKI
jgi:putative lipoic acid-binding regulatory protein